MPIKSDAPYENIPAISSINGREKVKNDFESAAFCWTWGRLKKTQQHSFFKKTIIWNVLKVAEIKVEPRYGQDILEGW